MTALRLTLRRLAAYGLDVALLAAVLLPIAFGAAVLLGTDGVTGPDVWVRSLIFVSLPAWAYFIGMERRRGATLAKRLLNVRTVDGAGSVPGSRAAAARTAVKLLPWELVHVAFFALAADFSSISQLQIGIAIFAYAFMLLLAAAPLWTGGHRSVHDIVAGTHVVVA